MILYMLTHWCRDHRNSTIYDDPHPFQERLIGIFDNLEKAHEAIDLLCTKHGFEDHRLNFNIEKIELNDISYADGF